MQVLTDRSTQGIELGAGIDISAGYTTLGVTGFEKPTAHAPIGPDSQNLAARLCRETQQGQTLVSGRSCKRVADLVDIESVGEPRPERECQRPAPAHNIICPKD